MRQIAILAGTLLLPSYLSYGLDPPVKLWERQYYSSYFDAAYFRDIEITDDGNLFISARTSDYTQPIHDSYVALLVDQDGEVIWEVPHEFAGGSGYDGTVLPDGSFVITGRAVEDSSSNSEGLYIHKISPEGTTIWAKVYDYPDTAEQGYSITSLPDGGFAVCGRVHGTGIQAGQAWLLRTDAQGDTLWTETWGTYNTNYGKTVLLNNNELCVLAMGRDDTLVTPSPHLLFYDLEGNYLRGTDYGDILYYLFPADMCLSTDGGYTFTTELWPPVWHTDQYGETLWWKSIYVTPNDWHKGYCIRQTMDSGYIFSGWDGYYEYEPGGNLTDYEEGWLARFDSEGNELWNINNPISVNHAFYSCLQLPQGGYMACGAYNVWESVYDGEETGAKGTTGFLARYAPETGISSPDPESSLTMDVSPNPFSSVLSVSFSQPEAGHASVRAYDLGGRLVSTFADGEFPSGSNTVEWSVPEDISSGCYFIQYNSDMDSVTLSVMLIK